MSKKLTIWWLTSAVIFNSRSLNRACNSFLALSPALALLPFNRAKPSSRYNPTDSFPNLAASLFKMKRPTRLHISAPSKLPIVTSNIVSLFRLTHGVSWLKSNDFRACLMIDM